MRMLKRAREEVPASQGRWYVDDWVVVVPVDQARQLLGKMVAEAEDEKVCAMPESRGQERAAAVAMPDLILIETEETCSQMSRAEEGD